MKKSFIIILMTLSLVCGALSVGLASKTDVSAADSSSIALADDFTKISNGESKGEVSNLAFGANETYGAVPGAVWGGTVSGGDGSIVYTLQAEEGKVLTSANVSFTAGGGHAGGVYWYNASGQLGANLKIFVSTDKSQWTEVFDFDKTAGKVKTNEQAYAAEGRYSNTESPLSLDTYIANSNVAYIRFEIEHFTGAETGISGWDTSGIPLDKAGLCLYDIAINAEQGEQPIHIYDITVSDDFTKISNGESKGEVNNLAFGANETYGAVPGAVWGGTVSGGDGSIVYTLQAEEGKVLTSANVSFTAGGGHAGGVYWYNAGVQGGENVLGANLKVFVSTDKSQWTEVFDFDKIAGKVKTNEQAYAAEGRYSNTESPLSLDKYIANHKVAYVRFEVEHFTGEETGLGWDSISLTQVGLCLYNVEINADEGEMAGIDVENDWTQGGSISSFEGLTDWNGVVKDEGAGNITYALIPAKVWGGVVDTCSGYLTYEIAADNGLQMKGLSLDLQFACFASLSQFTDGKADVKVQVSKDQINWETVYSYYENNGADSSFRLNDVTVDLSGYSDGYSVIYVKVVLQCPEVDGVALNQMPIILKKVHFTAEQELFAGKTEGILSFGNDKGTALQENYFGIVESSGVYDGNATFGLIPSSSWGGTVNASDGYFVYKVMAPDGEMFTNLKWDMAYKMLEGSDIILSVSYDGVQYTEFFDAAAVFGEKAYENPLIWAEDIRYRELSINLYEAVRNKQTVYIRLDIHHPTETGVALNALKAEIFEIAVYSTTQEYKEIGNLSYDLNGGSYEGAGNPAQYEKGQEIELKAPVREYYTFVGWYENADFTGDAVTKIDTSIIKDWKLYAKWEEIYYELNISVVGQGTMTNSDQDRVRAGSTLEFVLTPAEGWLIYSLRVDGEEVFLTDGTTYTIKQISEGYDIVATFAERETLHGDFSIRYDDSQKFGNDWKKGLYDFENLYITDDSFHALGIDGGVGYITYRFVADGGRTFESATLVTEAKLFDFVGMQTNERVDYYISYDDSDYVLVYKSLLNKQGENFVTVTQNLSEYVVGRTEFYLKIEVGSNSANWTLLNSLDISFTYEVVELTIDYGDYQDVIYTQEKGTKLDLSQIKLKEGYVLKSEHVYTDESRTQVWNMDNAVTEDMTIYLSVERVDGTVTYVLNGGKNAEENPETYDSQNAIVLKDAVREGYIFAGWYADEACTLRVTEIAAGRTGNITLYAKWVADSAENIPVKWEIEYVLNGGQNSAANAATYLSSQGFKLQAPTRVGYKFDGWYADPDFTEAISEIAVGTQGPITVYAKWTENAETATPKGGCGGSIGVASAAVAWMAVGAAVSVLLRKKGAHKEER